NQNALPLYANAAHAQQMSASGTFLQRRGMAASARPRKSHELALSTPSGLNGTPRAVIEKFGTGHSPTSRNRCLTVIQFLSLGDGGKPMRRTNSRKRGEERIESNSGAVRMNSTRKSRFLYAASNPARARGSSLSSA